MIPEIKTFEEFSELKEQEPALLAYFSTVACNVCKILKPKVAELLEVNFPLMKMVYIPSDELPEIAAQNQIFTAPTIVVFFEGREYIRKSRNIGINELQNEIERPYLLLFGD